MVADRWLAKAVEHVQNTHVMLVQLHLAAQRHESCCAMLLLH